MKTDIKKIAKCILSNIDLDIQDLEPTNEDFDDISGQIIKGYYHEEFFEFECDDYYIEVEAILDSHINRPDQFNFNIIIYDANNKELNADTISKINLELHKLLIKNLKDERANKKHNK